MTAHRRRRRTGFFAAAVALALGALSVVTPGTRAAASDPDPLASHTTIVSAAKLAADYYRTTYATTTVTPRNGWSWGTYAEGVHDLYRHAGDVRYQSDGMTWGASNSWGLTGAETNPDTIKAGQVYHALHEVDPVASLTAMDARMAADLTGLPLSQYDWIDALFMGLPDWALWSRRTGSTAYLDKLDALYAWTRDQGATSARCSGTPPPRSGLYDAATGLWYRDCTFVGVTDVNGKPVFWSRGNGWVIAAMADVLRSLPGDARAATYAGMLQTMAAALAPLQGSDGFWRSSLLDAALFPQPETSGTALITYALAYGIRAGVLEAATYLPVVARAWQGLSTTALQPSGFLTGCQAPGVSPAAPYSAAAPRTPATSTSSGTVNVDSPPFCVGAFLMAATQVAQLSPDLAAGRTVTATAQQAGNEAARIVDGDVTTRWSASPFPQAVTVDLGSAQTIGSTMVVPYLDRAYRYRIEASTDNATWTVLVDRSTNTRTGSQLDDVPAVDARFVRLTVVGVSGVSTTWASIQELAVYPPPTTAEPTSAFALDAFGRTVVGGWGSADVGGAWSLVGPATSFSVTAGQGRIVIPSAGVGRSAVLTTIAQTDVDAQVSASLDKPATGGGTDLTLTGRYVSAGTEYRAEAKVLATGAVRLSLRRFLGGAATTLTQLTVPGLAVTAGSPLRIRLQVTGTSPTTLRARTWLAAQTEPATWQVQSTDGSAALQRPGAVALATYASGSTSNTPVTAAFDDLAVAPIGGTQPPNRAPSAAFTPTARDLALSVDGSASSDPDGTITSYAWTFGDGGTGSGTTASHTYTAAGTYPVTLTVTDDDGATGQASAPVTVTAPAGGAFVLDAFGRTVPSGWGSADVGGAWSLVGPASSFSVTAGQGRIVIPSAGVGRSAVLTTIAQTDVDAQVSASLDKPATGGGTDLTLTGRYVSAGTEYRAEAKVLATGAVRLSLRRFLGGAATTLASGDLSGVTHTPGAQLRIRLQVTGTSPTTLRTRAWLVEQSEPGTWRLTTTDSTAALQAPGRVGVATYLSASTSNAPMTVSFDDLAGHPVP